MADIPIDPRKARYVVFMLIVSIGLLVGLTVWCAVSPYTSRFGYSSLALLWSLSLPFLWRHGLVMKTAYLGPNHGLHLIDETLIFATRKYKSVPIGDIVSCEVVKIRSWARDLPYLQLDAKSGRKIELPIFLLAEEPAEVGERVLRVLEAAKTGAVAGDAISA